MWGQCITQIYILRIQPSLDFCRKLTMNFGSCLEIVKKNFVCTFVRSCWLCWSINMLRSVHSFGVDQANWTLENSNLNCFYGYIDFRTKRVLNKLIQLPHSTDKNLLLSLKSMHQSIKNINKILEFYKSKSLKSQKSNRLSHERSFKNMNVANGVRKTS